LNNHAVNIAAINDSNDKFTDSFYVFCSYVVDTNLTDIQSRESRMTILNDYIDFITKDINRHNYYEILKKSFKTYDTYGFGLAVSQLTFSMKHLINHILYDELCEFSYKLIHPNVLKRMTVEEAIQKYDDILRMNMN
jgi:hypothetical protein